MIYNYDDQDIENLVANFNLLLGKHEALEEEVRSANKKADELERCLVAITVWTQYSFGRFFEHLGSPHALPLAQTIDKIEANFEKTMGKLKEGLRGKEELQTSKEGFERLYRFFQEIQNIWQSMRRFRYSDKEDMTGYKLINASQDMVRYLDPQFEKAFPLETAMESSIQTQRKKVIDRLVGDQPQ